VKKQTLIIAALGLSLLLLASMSMAQCPNSAAKSKTETTATMTSTKVEGETINLAVSNMTCDACVKHVTKTLAAVDGVKDVTVNLKDGTAEVVCDASKVKADYLAETVTKAGYPTKLAVAGDASAAKAAGCAATCGAKKGCDPAACGMKTAAKDEGKKDDGGKK